MMRFASGFECGRGISAGLKGAGRVLAMVCVVLAGVRGTRGVAQTSATVNATLAADSWIYYADPTTVEGGQSTLLVKFGGTNSGTNRNTFLRFTIPAEPAITGASLWLNGGFATSGDSEVDNVYPVTNTDCSCSDANTWIESGTGGLDWDNAPIPSGSTASVGSATVGYPAAPTQWVLNSTYVTGLPLTGGSTDLMVASTISISFPAASFSSDSGGNPPVLALTVPGPGAPAGLNVLNITAAPPLTTSETGMSLSWNAGSGSPYLGTTYTLFRSTTHAFTPVVCPGTGCNSIATGLTATTYTDSGLSPNTTYYYQVQWAYTLSNGTTLYSASSNENHNTTYASVQPAVAILIDPVFEGNTIPSPVLLAVANLQRDLQNVLGQTSVICPSNVESNCANYATRSIIVITGSESSTVHGTLPYNSGLTGFEVHSLSTVAAASGDPAGTPQRVVLQGSDTLGTIYAIYEFSQDYLGVPPLWYWTGWAPPGTAWTSAPVPSNLSTTFAAPVVTYRGVYPGDDDLLGPWLTVTTIAEPWMGTTTNYDAYFETLLRLKLNLLDVGDITDLPYVGGEPNYTSTHDQWAITAAKVGIFVGFTHTSPFGAAFDDWNNYWSTSELGDYPGCESGGTGCPVPSFTTTTYPNGQTQLEQFWKHYITLTQYFQSTYGMQVVETLAFRGAKDEPWWAYMTYDDPAVLHPTWTQEQIDAARANQISIELNDQLTYMNSAMGNNIPARIIFYDENQNFLAYQLGAGGGDGFTSTTFNPPSVTQDSNLIWSFTNTQRDHTPGPDAVAYSSATTLTSWSSQLVGYYENPEYESTGAHITSDEGPWKLESNHRYVMGQAPSGKYALTMLNLSNFREFSMEASDAAALLWQGLGNYPNGFTNYPAGTFTTAWQENKFIPMYFPAASPTTVEGEYWTYYNTIWQQNTPNFPTLSGGIQPFPTEYLFQDLRYQVAAEKVFDDLEDECYTTITTKCPDGVTPPYPFEDASTVWDWEGLWYASLSQPQYGPNAYYDINFGSSTNSMTFFQAALTPPLTTVASNFATVYSNCMVTEGPLPAQQQNYFIDSVCSNSQVMEYLNKFLNDLTLADESIPAGTPYTNLLSNLSNAQSDLTAIQTALSKRYTGESFATWYNNSTGFDFATLQTDLCNAIDKYTTGTPPTCPTPTY